MKKYPVTDRITGAVYSIQSDSGQIKVELDPAATPLTEPIVKDRASSTRWTIFVSSGQIGIDETVSTNQDTVELDDVTTGDVYLLGVEDGQIVLSSISELIAETASRKHYVGEVGTNLIYDTGIDISQASKVLIKVRQPDGKIVEWVATVFQLTKLRHISAQGELDLPGIYKIQTYIEDGPNHWHGETAEQPIYKLFE